MEQSDYGDSRRPEFFQRRQDSITADSTDARLVYAVWDRLDTSNRGPTYFSRTTDGGITWEVAGAIYDPGVNSQTLNNQVVVSPGWDPEQVFSRSKTCRLTTRRPRPPLAIIRSPDKGVTPGRRRSSFRRSSRSALSIRRPLRTCAATVPAWARSSLAWHGELAVQWQDSRFSNGTRDFGVTLFHACSTEGSPGPWPFASTGSRSVAAFVPAVTVRADGTYGVSYHDFRNHRRRVGRCLPITGWRARPTA